MKNIIIPGLLLLLSSLAVSQQPATYRANPQAGHLPGVANKPANTLQPVFESTRNITDAVSAADTKEASISITASSLVNLPAGSVTYRAGKFIELNPGFNTEMNSSSSFTASIGGASTLPGTKEAASADGKKKAEIPGDAAGFNVYPNPASDFLFIRMPLHVKALSVDIRDVQGRLMQAVLVRGEQATVNISLLAPGSYFLKVNAKEHTYKSMFIKQ
jgi:Secretion system C-terminal sorting domain